MYILVIKARPNVDAIKWLNVSLASSDQKKADLLNSYFSGVFTCDYLSNITTLKSKDDIPQLDDMIIFPSMICSMITKLKSEKFTGSNCFSLVFFLMNGKLSTSLQ